MKCQVDEHVTKRTNVKGGGDGVKAQEKNVMYNRERIMLNETIYHHL